MESEIKIPEGVTVAVEDKKVTVKGPKGSLEREFSDPRYDIFISMAKTDDTFKITTSSDRRKVKAVAGTLTAHVRNMIKGVTLGWRYKMKVFHTHFPMTVEVKGKEVIVKNFLGAKSLRKGSILGNTKVSVKKDDVTVTGIDKEDVSQTAANIETSTRLSGKDRRVFLDGVYITGWEHEETKEEGK